MNDEGVDLKRRRFLTASTSVVGAVGAGAATLMMINYMTISEKDKAQGAPIEVDISKLPPGKLLVVEWRNKPVWIMKRTPDVIKAIEAVDDDKLRDPNSEVAEQQPDYAKNKYRSKTKDMMVVIGLCTHLGCSPREEQAGGDLGADWPGGYLCACHGSTFDYAGRVYKHVPAPTNLVVPNHRFTDNNAKVIIGGVVKKEKKGAAS